MKYYLNGTDNNNGYASKEEPLIKYVNDDDALPNIPDTSTETGFQDKPKILKVILL